MYYFDEKRAKEIIKINEEYVKNLRIAIKNGDIADYFDSFGFKQNLNEIIHLLRLYPDAEYLFLSLYGYLIKKIQPAHIKDLVTIFSDYKNLVPLLERDANYLIDKLLNDKHNCFEDMYSFMKAFLLLPNGKKIILKKLNEILKVNHPVTIFYTISLFVDEPYFKNYFTNNFDKLLSLSRGQSVIQMVGYMMALDNAFFEQYIKFNFKKILINAGSSQIPKLFTTILVSDYYIEFVKENMEMVVENCSAKGINYFLNNFDDKYDLKLKENNDVVAFLHQILNDEQKNHNVSGAIIKSKRNEYIKKIIFELIEENGCEIKNLNKSGWSNIVFLIGDKLLKLGWIRNNPNCPDHHRIIKDILFEIIYDCSVNPVLYIELQDYLSQDNISRKDIEDFYSDIEKDGLIYIDPRGNDPVNFGWLEENNQKKLVLVDRDCIWKKNDPNIKYFGTY